MKDLKKSFISILFVVMNVVTRFYQNMLRTLVSCDGYHEFASEFSTLSFRTILSVSNFVAREMHKKSSQALAISVQNLER